MYVSIHTYLHTAMIDIQRYGIVDSRFMFNRSGNVKIIVILFIKTVRDYQQNRSLNIPLQMSHTFNSML